MRQVKRVRLEMLMEFVSDFNRDEIIDIMKHGDYFSDQVIDVHIGPTGWMNKYY